MTTMRISTIALTVLSLALASPSQNPSSGPKVGTPLTSVNVWAGSGQDAGREYDAAKALGNGPGALLFVHELTRNVAPVIRGLDTLGNEHAVLGFKWRTVWLSDDRTQAETRLRAVNGSLRLHEPMVLSTDGLEGPGNYALNRRCTLTLVIAKAGKVVRAVGFTDTGRQDMPQIRTWIEEVAGEVPVQGSELERLLRASLPSGKALQDLAVDQAMEIRRLKQQLARLRQNRGRRGRGMDRPPMRRGRDQDKPPPDAPGRKLPGKAPDDSELQTLLRSFIRKTNADERVDQVFADIVERAKTSRELTKQAVEMFKLVVGLKDRYGTPHAHELAEKYIKEHGKKKEG